MIIFTAPALHPDVNVKRRRGSHGVGGVAQREPGQQIEEYQEQEGVIGAV